MIRAIIFSRDRGCQLDALLQTLPTDVFTPTVLYRATTPAFDEGYDACMLRHPAVAFCPESDFRSNVNRLVPIDGLVCFFTDDDLVFGQIDERVIASTLSAQSVIAFSLRLGRNTTFCYPHRREQALPDIEDHHAFLVWQWQGADLDFGYPLSLDGHVLRAGDVRALFAGHDFANPNELEDVLARRARTLARPLLAAFPRSVLVGVPANRVNETHANHHAAAPAAAPEVLNERFLAGWRIDPALIPFERARGAHQEFDYVLWRAT